LVLGTFAFLRGKKEGGGEPRPAEEEYQEVSCETELNTQTNALLRSCKLARIPETPAPTSNATETNVHNAFADSGHDFWPTSSAKFQTRLLMAIHTPRFAMPCCVPSSSSAQP
jgi:hypothetical protein